MVPPGLVNTTSSTSVSLTFVRPADGKFALSSGVSVNRLEGEVERGMEMYLST